MNIIGRSRAKVAQKMGKIFIFWAILSESEGSR